MGSGFYDIAECAAGEGRASCRFHQIWNSFQKLIRNSGMV